MRAAAIGHCSCSHKLVDNLKHPAYVGRMTHDADLDAKGLLCPLPVLKARKRLQSLASGQVLRMEADDPAAVIDVPHFCTEAGHTLIGTEDIAGAQIYLIRKA
jgi:tRNA 2-thiouridine synthesizing protein A